MTLKTGVMMLTIWLLFHLFIFVFTIYSVYLFIHLFLLKVSLVDTVNSVTVKTFFLEISMQYKLLYMRGKKIILFI